MSERYERLQFKKETFEIGRFVEETVDGEKEGVIRVKLFSHRANQEGGSAENLDNLSKIMKDTAKVAHQGKIAYKFKKVDFPEQEIGKEDARAENIMKEFMGTNLIIVFSSLKSLQGDIDKVKKALVKCPRFSSFSMLWIVNQPCKEENL